MILAVVAALLHAKVCGAVPPDPLAVADPLLPPLQLMFVFTTVEAITGEVIFTSTLSVAVQPFASVTITVYVPEVVIEVVCVVALLDHA